ncbi:hypothetical protein FB451DRAFT_1174594 [Mycena latifolia]|nr:hypothetical protein FB451DRAFT_1174594 [Mycena latifolia]
MACARVERAVLGAKSLNGAAYCGRCQRQKTGSSASGTEKEASRFGVPGSNLFFFETLSKHGPRRPGRRRLELNPHWVKCVIMTEPAGKAIICQLNVDAAGKARQPVPKGRAGGASESIRIRMSSKSCKSVQAENKSKAQEFQLRNVLSETRELRSARGACCARARKHENFSPSRRRRESARVTRDTTHARRSAENRRRPNWVATAGVRKRKAA